MASEIDFPDTFNRELILDLTLEAFSVYNFEHTDAPKVHDYLPLRKTIKTDTEVSVLDEDGNVVVDASGATVTVTEKVSSERTKDPRVENFKMLTTQGSNITLSEYWDKTFYDFRSHASGPFNFSSYLVTGHNFSENFLVKKQAIYLLVFCKKTEKVYGLVGGLIAPFRPSSCFVQARWDWHDSVSQGKWGTEFQAYRLFLPKQETSPSVGDAFNYGAAVIQTKNKLRGSGGAISLRFRSEEAKDLILLGWGIQGYINDNP